MPNAKASTIFKRREIVNTDRATKYLWENRWYGAYGRKKRIGGNMEKFSQFAEDNKSRLITGDWEILRTNLKWLYPRLTVNECTWLTVYINGVFNNGDGDLGHIFNTANFIRGQEVAERL